MKQKADELQAWEEEKLEAQWQAEMYQKELRFKQKLKGELVALKQRIASGSAEQKRQRQVDTERYCVSVVLAFASRSPAPLHSLSHGPPPTLCPTTLIRFDCASLLLLLPLLLLLLATFADCCNGMRM